MRFDLARTSLICAAVALASGSAHAADPPAPDWVKSGGSTLKRPRLEYLTGFAMVDGGSALERAKVQAAADLARSVTVRVESDLSDVTAEKNGAQEYSVAAFTRATSDIRFDGLAYETYASGASAYALAYIRRADAANGQRRVRDDAMAKARAAVADAERLQAEKQEAAALARLYAARRPIAEALEHDAILRAIASGEGDAKNREELLALTRTIDDGVRKLLQRKISSFKDAADVLAIQLREQGVSSRSRLLVEPPTYGSTGFTSPFGRQLATDLERAVAASGAAPGAAAAGQVVLRGSYVELEGDLQVTVLARDSKEGATLGSAEVRLPQSAVPAAFPFRPQNFAAALEAQKILQHGEEVSGDLKLEIWTNKGERNLVFDEGDEVKLFMRVNRPAYVRLIYLLANGLRVPLQQSYFIDSTKVNRAVEYPETFVVSPPFGVEHIYATAFTEAPVPLPTKKVNVQGEEYEVVSEDLQAVVVKTRGLQKKKDPKAQSVESSLALTTMDKR